MIDLCFKFKLTFNIMGAFVVTANQIGHILLVDADVTHRVRVVLVLALLVLVLFAVFTVEVEPWILPRDF